MSKAQVLRAMRDVNLDTFEAYQRAWAEIRP